MIYKILTYLTISILFIACSNDGSIYEKAMMKSEKELESENNLLKDNISDIIDDSRNNVYELIRLKNVECRNLLNICINDITSINEETTIYDSNFKKASININGSFKIKHYKRKSNYLKLLYKKKTYYIRKSDIYRLETTCFKDYRENCK